MQRVQQGRRVLQTEGARGLAQRAGPGRVPAPRRRRGPTSPSCPADVADSQSLVAARARVAPDAAAPHSPSAGSWPRPRPGPGGHTTTFRLVEGLERAGHTCVLYLYDRYQGDIRAAGSRHPPALAGRPGPRCDRCATDSGPPTPSSPPPGRRPTWWPPMRTDRRDACTSSRTSSPTSTPAARSTPWSRTPTGSASEPSPSAGCWPSCCRPRWASRPRPSSSVATPTSTGW